MEPEIPSSFAPADQQPSIEKQIFLNEHGLRAGWRLAIYCAMILVLVFGARFVANFLARHAGAGGPQSNVQLPDLAQAIGATVSEFIVFLVLLFLAWIMSKIEHRNVGSYGLPLQKSVFSVFWSSYVLWGFLPLAVLLFILRAGQAFHFGGLSPLNIQIVGWGVLWWVFFLVVGLFEEFCFRGYFLHTLAEGIGFWPAAIIQAILFARVHMGNGGETRIGIIAAGVFALFAAATLWRTGNLWLAVGAHAGWDWGQSFFFGVNDSGLKVSGHLLNPSVGGPDWLSGGSVGPEGSVVTLILWIVMTALFILFYKKRPQPALVITEAPKY